jgi:ankyrin repeat protein
LDYQGSSLLHVAVSNKSASIVKLLIDNKADVKAKDQFGLTPLVYALKGRDTEIVHLLKEAGGSY